MTAYPLALGEKERPDLIIADVMMPGMTGWEALRRLRESALAEVPVIVLSARGSPEDVAQILRRGAPGDLGRTAGRDRLRTEIRSLPGAAAGPLEARS